MSSTILHRYSTHLSIDMFRYSIHFSSIRLVQSIHTTNLSLRRTTLSNYSSSSRMDSNDSCNTFISTFNCQSSDAYLLAYPSIMSSDFNSLPTIVQWNIRTNYSFIFTFSFPLLFIQWCLLYITRSHTTHCKKSQSTMGGKSSIYSRRR